MIKQIHEASRNESLCFARCVLGVLRTIGRPQQPLEGIKLPGKPVHAPIHGALAATHRPLFLQDVALLGQVEQVLGVPLSPQHVERGASGQRRR